MKLHRNLVFAAVDALQEIFNDGKYADKVLQGTLKRDKRWGARDRSFIAETVYDIVRWKRLYVEIAEVKEPFDRQKAFRLFTVWATLRGITVPDWKQLEETPTRRIKGKFDALSKIRKFRESIPDWLDALGEKELGKKWDDEIAALNQQADVILRVNTLKTTIDKLQATLFDLDLETEKIKGYPDALKLKERANVFQTEAFSNGWFEVQDASSQLVAEFLEVQPGMRVVDACAGAGGKALHLASIMENKGQLIALDIYANKLNELKRRAKRAGAFNIETRLIDTTKVIKKLHEKADRVLIDAPCSGLGVLRRNPDAKWKLQPEFIENIKKTQAEILDNYSKMVKPGGKMIYATCSILPSENEKQIKDFLKRDTGKDFTFAKEKKVLPSTSGFDGFYMALLEKK
ncbi:MAG: RNA methyltransferase [Flavobacteriaceae bacterium CG_4_8_14_3_um_filter_34_10]|nr:methyltransferase domain-containing protein [Flavobacteriia bacterium]OIP51665.1 MAG: RNA methyltransferase [Flavobacteriaceae bacterium CG2_30_34_30]PIQ17237.1 MAG: RNA methyltransferase [Flavobacteriaceae bacterium CG18_big_fil_WC_8_21_14_2_50_34_36]PIV48611.1 MAG: RNA methyltransferase [Flavobacteriaceae bacterium CG02_land_8_20_14_3_00_34_13]PIX08927.1 MAG: RNA methyltransferase [Flavobacteriaceae bacterium CG_4_8_14_3_um_filter_34_10]PIZ07055.1 MAG: RNA methyltransferase [Flavobacteria